MGMPSSLMRLKVSGLMTSPGVVLTVRMRPSRCLKRKFAPHSASARLIFFCGEEGRQRTEQAQREFQPATGHTLRQRGAHSSISAPKRRD